jgi:hypothetical protein
MEKVFIFFILTIAFISCNKNENLVGNDEGSVEVKFQVVDLNNQTPSNSGFSGTSNSVLSNGVIWSISASSGKSNFPGYPDANSKFYTLSLEQGVTNSQTISPTSAASDINHTSLTQKPNGNVVAVFQKPTGKMYGFDLEYKEFSSSGSLIKSEKVFTNENWGAWPRLEFTSNGIAHLVSFAHEGYYLKYFRKSPNANSWEYFNLTADGKYSSDIQTAVLGNDCLVSVKQQDGNNGILKLFTISGDYQSENNQLDQHIEHNCDLLSDANGNTCMLYTVSDQLKIIQINGWRYETVAYDKDIEHRAKMIQDTYGTLTVVYQTTKKIVVLKQQNYQWVKIWQLDFSSTLNPENLGQGPSLINANDGMYVVYPDNNGVIKHKL